MNILELAGNLDQTWEASPSPKGGGTLLAALVPAVNPATGQSRTSVTQLKKGTKTRLQMGKVKMPRRGRVVALHCFKGDPNGSSFHFKQLLEREEIRKRKCHSASEAPGRWAITGPNWGEANRSAFYFCKYHLLYHSVEKDKSL